jgi:putative GTP pyrophosphokinase
MKKDKSIVKDGTSPIELSADQLSKIESDYNDSSVRHQALLEEVVFILSEKLKSRELKIHAIEKRVKELSSVIGKCKRENIGDFAELRDVVGARVICLFRLDMDDVGKLITENFDVVEVDDKLSIDNNPLGYLSVHYSCKIPAHYKGPRYENTGGVVFEIQVRALCMHCWAAVSHYLDYKGDWDVPVDLKRALSALSGLFYVADNEFEQFYSARTASLQRAKTEVESFTEQEINFDTKTAYVRNKYSDRIQSDSDSISQLVQQTKAAGYKSIAEIDKDVGRATDAFNRYEKDNPPFNASKQFHDVGVVRVSLNLASEEFRKYSWLRTRATPENLEAYRQLLK